ncbi:ferredoxin [Acidiferrimicrobium sp. IK]|uniref:ferredoxin n=1 Tax=Acidiferrimicrobium sp. IK TaxID=2871700 RepID=UPI0021CB376A|nr:ferredoxin [Acidiferrimicrobium sp. IK]MCU4183229.1 ferredoxin [Acidiferrimicrobium sp. IK]
MKVTIDTDRCTGHGRCYSLAPEVFEADDEGYGAVIGGGDVPEALADKVELGRASCPEQAITVTQ